MASKRDYDAVVGKAARRGRVVEVAAASFNANPKARAAALEIANSPTVNRKRAELKFDAAAKRKAKTR